MSGLRRKPASGSDSAIITLPDAMTQCVSPMCSCSDAAHASTLAQAARMRAVVVDGAVDEALFIEEPSTHPVSWLAIARSMAAWLVGRAADPHSIRCCRRAWMLPQMRRQAAQQVSQCAFVWIVGAG